MKTGMLVWPLAWALMWVCVAKAASVGAKTSQDLPPLDATHKVVMDRDGSFLLHWCPRKDHIEFEVQVATRGYVGLGFSPSGGMKNADIVLGWVADGEVVLHDRHAEGYMIPVIDESQDVTLVGGYENDTHTVLRFTRPWNTCDTKQDLELGDDTLRVIWSYSYEDPIDEVTMSIHNHRGTKSLYLKGPQFQGPPSTPDIKTWDVRSDNTTLPDNVDTIYWCKLFKVPDTDKKHHIIGVTPIIEEANLEYVHHIVVYECRVEEDEKHLEKWLSVDGLQCFSASMPMSWRHCRYPLLAWAVGGQGDLLPDHVGFPLGKKYGGSDYIMFEVHYDNPNLRSGVVDSSGLRLHYTDKLRKYDAAVMIFGHHISAAQVVPPQQEHWKIIGHCAEHCTKQGLPEEGVHVFQGILHSHVIGASLSLRHIRDGVELPPILKDKYYDFNFQQTRVLKEEKTILPGDSFFVECDYDSRSRRGPTFGGLGTSEEMCMAFLTYYPSASLESCMSSPKMDSVWKSLGIDEVDELPDKTHRNMWGTEELDADLEQSQVDNYLSGNVSGAQDVKISKVYRRFTAKGPEKYAKRTLFDILHDPDTWADESIIQKFKEMVLKDKQGMICDMKGNVTEEMKRYSFEHFPTFTPYKTDSPSCPSVKEELVRNESSC